MQGRGRAQDVVPGSPATAPPHQGEVNHHPNGRDIESEYDEEDDEEDEDDEDDEDGEDEDDDDESDITDNGLTNSPRPPNLTPHEFKLWQASHFPDHAPFRRSKGPNPDPVNNPQNFVRNHGTPGNILRITNLQPNVSPAELQNLLQTTGAKVTDIIILSELGPMLQYRNRELGVDVQWQIAFVTFATVEEAERCFVLEDRLVGPKGNTSQIRIDFADAEVSQTERRRSAAGIVNGERSVTNGVLPNRDDGIAGF